MRRFAARHHTRKRRAAPSVAADVRRKATGGRGGLHAGRASRPEAANSLRAGRDHRRQRGQRGNLRPAGIHHGPGRDQEQHVHRRHGRGPAQAGLERPGST